jgi:hypothetical protein
MAKVLTFSEEPQSTEGHEAGQQCSNNAETLGQRMTTDNKIMISQKRRQIHEADQSK